MLDKKLQAKDNPELNKKVDVPNDELPFKKSFFRDWFEVIMYGLAIFMFLKGFVFQNFQIPTSSMENTLLIGDHLTANKFIYAPYQWEWEKKLLPLKDIERGDVVVFKYPLNITDDYIKRCVGIPGDRFEIRKHRIYVNGELIPENYTYYKAIDMSGSGVRDEENANYPLDYETLKPGILNSDYVKSYFYIKEGEPPRNMADIPLSYILSNTRQSLRTLDPTGGEYYQHWLEKQMATDGFVVPDGFYLMMGDNRNNSADSRFWGLVPRPLIEGRAYCVWWSYGEDTGSHTLTGFELVWSYVRVLGRFFTHTHWERCFHIID